MELAFLLSLSRSEGLVEVLGGDVFIVFYFEVILRVISFGSWVERRF